MRMAGDNDPTQRDIGRLEGQVQALTVQVAELNKTVAAMNKTISEAKGGWKTLLIMGGMAGTLGGVVAKYMSFLVSMPR